MLNAAVDVGGAVKGSNWAPSVLYHEEIGLRKAPWLQLGLGLRAWGYYSGSSNLFTNKGSEGSDRLEFNNTSDNGISFVVGANVKFGRIVLGANTDLAGFSYGSKRTALYPKTTTTPGSGEANYGKRLAVSPTILSIVPLALNNYNGLSEVYGRVWITKKVGLKLGYTYGQVAYKTRKVNDRNVYMDNKKTRVSDNFGMLTAAVSFSISD